MSVILPAGTALYRYCLGTEVPTAWSTDYHSPEYFSPKYGDKNQIGAFFFYPHEQTARNVLSVAVQQQEGQGHPYPNNIITNCHTTADINLLDITNCQRPVNILNILHDEGIDVLTTDFNKYLDDIVSFNQIRGHHQFIMQNEGTNDRIVRNDMNEYGVQIDQFFHWRVQYTGQLLRKRKTLLQSASLKPTSCQCPFIRLFVKKILCKESNAFTRSRQKQ